MKTIAYLTFFMIICGCAFGQETVKRSQALTGNIYQSFEVLKSNKSIKHGTYVAIANGKPIAQGNYRNGKRVGYWSFYNKDGKLVQSFNYSKNQIIFTDTTDTREAICVFAETINEGDTVSNAVKIGGYSFGLMSLLQAEKTFTQQVVDDFKIINKSPANQDGKSTFDCKHIFTVDTTGTVTRHEVVVAMGNTKKLYTLDDVSLDDEFKMFVPGTINGRPVECKLILPSPFSISTRSVTRSYIISTSSSTTVPGGTGYMAPVGAIPRRGTMINP